METNETDDDWTEELTQAGFTQLASLEGEASVPATSDDEQIAFVSEGSVVVIEDGETAPTEIPEVDGEAARDLCFGRGAYFYTLTEEGIVPLTTGAGKIDEPWLQNRSVESIDAFPNRNTIAAVSQTGNIYFRSGTDGHERNTIRTATDPSDSATEFVVDDSQLFCTLGDRLACYDHRGSVVFETQLPASARSLAVLESRVVVAGVDGQVYWFDFDGEEKARVAHEIERLADRGSDIILGVGDGELLAVGESATVEAIGDIGDRNVVHTTSMSRVAVLGTDGAVFEYSDAPSATVSSEQIDASDEQLGVELRNPLPAPFEFELSLRKNGADESSGTSLAIPVPASETKTVELPVGDLAEQADEIVVEMLEPDDGGETIVSVTRPDTDTSQPRGTGRDPETEQSASEGPAPTDDDGRMRPTEVGTENTDPSSSQTESTNEEVGVADRRSGDSQWEEIDGFDDSRARQPDRHSSEAVDDTGSTDDDYGAGDRGGTPSEPVPPSDSRSGFEVDCEPERLNRRRLVATVTITNSTANAVTEVRLGELPQGIEQSEEFTETLDAGGSVSAKVVGDIGAFEDAEIRPQVRGLATGSTTVTVPSQLIRMDGELTPGKNSTAVLSIQAELPTEAPLRVALVSPDESVDTEWLVDLQLKQGDNTVVVPIPEPFEPETFAVDVLLIGHDERLTLERGHTAQQAKARLTSERNFYCWTRTGYEQYSNDGDHRFTSPIVQTIVLRNEGETPTNNTSIVGHDPSAGQFETGPVGAGEKVVFGRVVKAAPGTVDLPPISIVGDEGSTVGYHPWPTVETNPEQLDARVRIQPRRKNELVFSVALSSDRMGETKLKRLTLNGGTVDLEPDLTLRDGPAYWSEPTITRDSVDELTNCIVTLTLEGEGTEFDLLTVADVRSQTTAPISVEAKRAHTDRQIDLNVVGSEAVTGNISKARSGLDSVKLIRTAPGREDGYRIKIDSRGRTTVPLQLDLEMASGSVETVPFLLDTTDPAVKPVAGSLPIGQYFGEEWPFPITSGWERMSPEDV